MAFSIPKTEIIKYSPDELRSFTVSAYEYIDNLNFLLDPKDCVLNFESYLTIATDKFLKAGWNGDGEINLLWIPPFLQKDELQYKNTYGITVWHVKQLEDGTSLLLHPPDMFEMLR